MANESTAFCFKNNLTEFHVAIYHCYLKGVNFPDCNAGRLAITDNADDSRFKYEIFNSYPHFCGSAFWADDENEMVVW